MLWLFNHKRANFCFQIWDLFSLFSFLKRSLHKGEYNCAEKVFWIQDAGPAIFTFLGNRTFSEKIVPQNIFTAGYFIATFCVYRQNKRKMDNFSYTGQNF